MLRYYLSQFSKIVTLLLSYASFQSLVADLFNTEENVGDWEAVSNRLFQGFSN